MEQIVIFTIGFTKKSAETFFTKLNRAGVERLVDVRLNNTSQLAGFAKKEDLAFFLKAICKIDYTSIPDLAPTSDMLDAYKKQKGDWRVYERRFLHLMQERKVEANISQDMLNNACLLCSEDKPHYCHRRLVAEYLKEKWGNVVIKHLE